MSGPELRLQWFAWIYLGVHRERQRRRNSLLCREGGRAWNTSVAMVIPGFGGYAFPPVAITGLGERWMAMERKEVTGGIPVGEETVRCSVFLDREPKALAPTSPPIHLPCLTTAQQSPRGAVVAEVDVCSSPHTYYRDSGFSTSLSEIGKAFCLLNRSSETLYLPKRVARHKNTRQKKVQNT